MTHQIPWYYRSWCLAVALALFGPLALPIVWRAPQVPRWAKWTISALVVILTWWLTARLLAIGTRLMQRLNVGRIIAGVSRV